MVKYEGFINGCPVTYENEYCLSDKRFLEATYEGVRKCLKMVPEDTTQFEFLKGMLVLTKGHVNPQIIKDVYNESI